MALHVHRAERTDLLADGLGALLAAPLDDPFEQEVVVVPARGVERWLTQRLSHRLGAGPRGGDGVCAGVRFLSPHSLVSMLLGRELDDPWEPDRLAWPLLEVIDDSLGEPWCATLAAHLGHGIAGEEGELRASRRYAVAHRLAGLYSSYARQRVDLVRAWRLGDDTDGLEPLPDDLAWQAELWRRLVSRVDEPPPDVRHEQTLAALAAGGTGLDLPGRLSLFGHTRLPATEIELLGALGEHRDVHLWLPQASAALWADLAGPSTEGPVPRDDDRSSTYAGHPLLASLGRDARELQRSLAVLPGAVDAPSLGAVPAGNDLLGHLQADIRANHAPTPIELSGRALAEADRSVQVHACHGPARQVEVLREVLVGLLQDDPTLEPRDIVVMCPDVETYAPLIEAGFGLADVVPAAAGAGGHPAHHLRVRLADRALSSTNPLFSVALSLVSLAAGRARASEVLDLIGLDVCRRRFGLDDDDLTRVAGWVSESGVRWGLDGWQRARFKMEGFRQNTWRAGLDRVLTGVALSGDEHVHLGVALPLDDVGSGDVELAGRLAEFVDRLETCLQRLDAAATVPDWLGALGDGVRGLARVPEADAVAAGAVRPGAEPDAARLGRGRRVDPTAAGRRPGPAHRATRRTAHARQLPHRHPHRLHDGPDALGAPPGRVPGRPRRRRLPPLAVDRRRRRAGPAPAHRRARPPVGGPPAAARRDHVGHRAAGGLLHRRQRAHRCRPPARRATGRAARHPRPHGVGRRARAGADPPPAAGLRHRQPHGRRGGSRPSVQLRSRRAGRCAGGRGGAHTPGAVPSRPAAARASRRTSASTTCTAS